MADDFKANARTTGTVTVGGSATGEIGKKNDVDWFAVELVAGQTYVIDLEGAPTGAGTLGNAMLRGLYDAGGNRIAGTRDHDGGEGANARLVFTATESGTHYIAARSQGGDTGSYTVRVTAFDADATAAGATDLGDLAALDRTRTQQDTVDGGADGTDYYRFTLSEARTVQLTLRRQDADADLYLEDADGNVLHSSTRGGTRNDGIDELLEAGTYYVRVVAQEEGENAYKLRYSAAAPEPEAQPEPDPEPQPQQGAPQQQQVVVPTNVPEPEGQDFSSDTSTEGRVLVGGSVTGDYGGYGWAARDDWFAVELKAGKTYVIDLKGAPNGDGTMSDPMIRGVYDADGNVIAYTHNDDGGVGRNARTLFTPDADGTYYVAASGYGIEATSYTLSVAEIVDRFTADTGTTGKIAVGGSATGQIGIPNDVDWFAVTLEAGKTYRVDLKGAPTGDGTLPDPVISGIHDADGNVVANTSNNNDGVGNNARSFITPGTAGTYYVAAGGTGTGTYTLSVTEPVDDFTGDAATTGTVGTDGPATGEIGVPNDVDWFAVTLEKGKVYRFDLKGTPTGEGTLANPVLRGIHDADGNVVANTALYNGGVDSALSFIAPGKDGTYYVAASGAGAGTGTYTLSVAEVPDDFPADTGTAGRVVVGGSATGEVEAGRDVDWFAVELEAGKTYRIDVKGQDTGDGTLEDPEIRGIYDAGGTRLAHTEDEDSGRGRNSQAIFTADADATYYVAAHGFLDHTGTYTVSVTEGPDDFGTGNDTAGAVAVGGSATGEIEIAGDRDWFAVNMQKGKTYRIDLKGSPTDDGTALQDPFLGGIYGSHLWGEYAHPGTADDNGGEGNNSRVTFTAPETDIYLVEAGGEGDHTGAYTVSVADVSPPPPGGWRNVREPRGEDFPGDASTPGRVLVGGSVRGKITDGYDYDWFAVELEAGKTYRFDLKGAHTGDGTLLEPFLNGIYHGTNDRLPMADTTNQGGSPTVFFKAPESATYYVEATTFPEAVAYELGTYTLSVAEAPDDFTADTATTGKVAVYGSATGEITITRDIDWFAAELQAGKTYQIDLKGAHTGDGTMWNPFLHGIHDAEGNLIPGTTNDDEYSPTGDYQSRYGSRVFFTPDEDGTYYVAAGVPHWEEGQNWGLSGTYTVFVTDTSTDDFAADTGTDGAVAVGGSATGRVETPDDRDWFTVTLEEGKTYRFDLAGSSAAGYALRDPMLYGIHDADGILIPGTANDDGGDGTGSRVRFTASESGTYYVSAGADNVDPEIRPGYYVWADGEPDAAARYFGRDGVEGLKLGNLGGYALSVEEVVDAM